MTDLNPTPRHMSVGFKRFLVYLPLVGHVIPTLFIGFVIIIPGSSIAGWNIYTFGFLSAVIGFIPAYVAGLQLSKKVGSK